MVKAEIKPVSPSELPSRRLSHQSDLGYWESILRDPDPRLRGYVEGPYQGFVERSTRVICRREVPTTIVPLILNFGPAYGLVDPRDPNGPREYRSSFVAGLADSYALVESCCESLCLQVNFTPLGARLFLGQPMGSLCNLVVEFEDVIGSCARRLVQQIGESSDWDSRFDLLDRAILSGVVSRKPMPAKVAWAWHRLTETSGLLSISDLSQELGWSRKHLADQFRQEIGLPPKVMARVLRFNRLVRQLSGNQPNSLTDLALRCGYYDQAHLNRDFFAFAGVSPTRFLESSLPNGYGVLAS